MDNPIGRMSKKDMRFIFCRKSVDIDFTLEFLMATAAPYSQELHLLPVNMDPLGQ